MCHVPEQMNVKMPSDCKCYKAVMKAYGSLMHAGRPDSIALEAAVIVYGYHHPEDSKEDRTLTVERWVNEQSIH
ncbi:MAG: hypothetical protein ACRBCK_09590 [Alphaproteobacteria bacterium]